jgi:hypothetical protein
MWKYANVQMCKWKVRKFFNFQIASAHLHIFVFAHFNDD